MLRRGPIIPREARRALRSEVYKFVARDRVGIARGSLRAVKYRAAHIYFDGVRTVA